MGTRSCIIFGGTRVAQSLVMRRKEAYVCMGMMPGMTGTVIPAYLVSYTKSSTCSSHVPFARTFCNHCKKPSTS